MIRQCALRWATVLTLVATVVIAPLPARFPTALAQDTSAVDAGEPAELAIAALHCAEAPASDALTTFFTSGAAPGGCSPAVGVTISVSEDGAPTSSSPAATDVNGIVVLPVTLGAAVEVREDPASLPDGYAPLTQEANGVPYANPVQIDSAVAGAAVLFVNVPRGAATELAQEVPADDEGGSTDLAVLALQCAAAPTAETLTSFFSSGTPPGGCAPAAGVRVAVTENTQPLAGSPFTTGADGALSIPVALGAVVSVKEDLASLPSGYEPLTQAANGVPYANPVELDAATADSAVLFVNVPASVAATHLAQVASPDRAGCDPAYPDARTCIAPGRPLAVPCSITDQRNFTVLAPDPRRLDADRDGIGCEPIAPAGGTVSRNASGNLPTTSTVRRAAPVRTGGTVVVASQMRSDAGAWGSAPASRRANPLVAQRDRGNAGPWYAAPARRGTGNVAIVSNPVFIANGLWCWPDRVSRDNWLWRQRNLRDDGSRFLPHTLHAGNVTVAGSGSGNVAIVSNPVFISQGVWAWPDRDHGNDWSWRNRAGSGGWRWGNRADHETWSWPNWFNLGNVTVARSGTGNIAIASNPVFIGRGVWHWPGRMNAGGWPGIVSTGNLVIARSGDNIAIVSNPVVIISGGLWYVPPTPNRDHDWYDRRDRDDDDHGDRDNDDHGNHDNDDHGNRDDADVSLMQGGSAQAEPTDDVAQTIDGDSASEASPSETEPLAASTQPELTVNGGLAVEPAPADAVPPPGDEAVAAPTEADPVAGSGEVALPSEGTSEPPSDGAADAPADTAADAPVATDAPVANDIAPDPGYVAPDPGYVAPDPAVDTAYVEPTYIEPAYVDPAYVEPTYVEPVYVEQEPAYVDAGADPGYVAPEPVYVEPVYVEQEPSYVDAGNVDTGWVAPDPVFAPSANEPPPSVVDTGFAANDVAPAPAAAMPEPMYVAPEPSFVDAGGGAASPGLDGGFGGQNANTVVPEPNGGNSGMDGGFVDAGNAGGGAGNMSPDPGLNDVGNSDLGGGAAEEGSGGG